MTAEPIVRYIACASAMLGMTLFALPTFADGDRSRSGGALSRTTGAVNSATSRSTNTGGASSGSSSSSSSDSHGHYHYDYDYARPYCATCTYVAPGGPPSTQPRRSLGRTELSLDLGLQSVKDSDGAIMGEVRIGRGNLGLGVAGTRYFERSPALDGSDTVYMNIWAVTVGYRGFDDGRTRLWLNGGLAGASSNNFEASLRGATVGFELESRVTRSLRLLGNGRYFLLSEGIRASELKAAISASYLSLGYRVLRFDVGEPLHGPEFGVALRF